MQAIADWLERLGMSEYAQRFAENDIDIDVLSELTDQDFDRLGVSLGHRRRMLRAIRELGASPIAAVTERQASAPMASEPASKDTAERRQVTVMFSDLVGSTALSARMDPEDLREVISTYQKCVAETVRRFGGFVAKYLGDGVLVYFGYPQAHEDDAERAVRAGLELVAAVTALKTQASLQTRVGIATGVVVVGDLIGSGEAQERGIVGETPNLAARLQGIAEPNTVVIAESTRKLLGSLFELHDFGAKDLKGIGEPVRTWAVLRPGAVESRFDALHTSGLTELVGREEELELLLRRWSKAKTGEGQVVLLSGEAGIGKSRLTAALLERLTSEPHTRLRYFCSPQHTDSSLYPIIGQMERAAGFARDDTEQTKLNKLDAVLALAATSIEDATLFAEMLSLSNDGRYPVLQLAPLQRRQRTLEALASQVAALTGQNPVVAIFEDAQWADPTSLEVLGRVVAQLRTLRALLVVTFRPEFHPSWLEQQHVTGLIVKRLADREIAELIDHVLGKEVIPGSIREDIIERSDGIPLFVEEMTKTVLEAGSDTAEQILAALPSSALAVPASLHASLMARLDRLGPAKEVAQVAAAIGREFPHELLGVVASKPEAQLLISLDRLIDAGLLFRQGEPPHASYLFKHALVQDVAYGALLREPRRSLHGRIAQALEAQFTEVAASQPELLARHFTKAGLIEKAAYFWEKAGHRSLQRSALAEAIEQLSRALDQLAALPGTPELRRKQIELQVALLNPIGHVKGFAAPETKAAVQRARVLIEQAEALGEPPARLFSVLFGLWVTNLAAFNGDALRELAAQFLALSERQGAAIQLMIGHRLMGTSLLHAGDFGQCRSHFDRAITLYDPATHRPLAARFGQDSGVAILCYRSWAQWMLGCPEASLADADRALKYAQEIDHAPTLMFALTHLSITYILCRKDEAATALLNQIVALADEKGALFWKNGSIMLQGCVLSLNGEAAAAVKMITSVIAAARSTGATMWLPLYLLHLGNAYGHLGEYDEAWGFIGEAMTTIEATKERWWESELNRTAGELALKSRGANAEEYFDRALVIARRQQAKSWELRAAMSMARLWRDQGKREEARELLAPVYGWFTEGFDTLDLKEAKALLDELAS